MPSASTPNSTIPIPALGSLAYLSIRLTEDADDTGGTIVATRITAMLERCQIRDRHGSVILNCTGLELERIANALSPAGQDVDAPAPGDGTAVSWANTIPISIAEADMPAFLDITWAPESALYSASPTGDDAVTCEIRGAYIRGNNGIQTLRIKSSTPPESAGDNSLQPYLPQGELVDRLLLLPNDGSSNPLADGDITSLRLAVGGFNLIDNGTVNNTFSPADVQERRDGHIDGTIIVRTPVFRVANTGGLNLNLGTSAGFNLVTVSRRDTPEQ